MKKILTLIFTALVLTSCGQDYNSNYGDSGSYSPIEGIDSSTPEGTRLLAAYKVVQTKCLQCHQWSTYKTSAAWVSAGLVVAGNSGASELFTILKNNGGSMPPDPIAQLTSEELESIKTWIDNLQ